MPVSQWSWKVRSAVFLGWACAAPAAVDAADVASPAPTYHKEVVRVIQKNCQECHRPGQVAPFALLTYDQAAKRAGDLAEVAASRQMPPWRASPDYGGPFHDERRLSDSEIALFKDWAEAGAPEGDPADAPPPLEFPTAWPLGTPDLALTMPEPYDLGPEGDDEFRVFVLKTDFPEDRWIRAVDFQPGNRRIVHHVIAAVDASGKAREKDAKDPGPGYSAVGGFGDGVPLVAFLPIWTPGAKARFAPEGAGYFLPKGADVLIQVHYHRTGKPETDATTIGLYLSDAPLSKKINTGFVFPTVPTIKALAMMKKAQDARKAGSRIGLTDMLNDVLVIPPGERNYKVTGSTGKGMSGRPLQRDILVTGVMPHMHWLGKDFTFWAVLPDEKNTRVPLIRIDDWDFNWQGTYSFKEPVRLPKGSWLEIEAHFDNSPENPANPSKPPKTVRWGDGTNDEMCLGIFEFMAADSGPPKPDAR